MSEDIIPSSKLSIHNIETDTYSNIMVEKVIPNKDVKLKITPTDNYYMTKKRLTKIKEKINSYLKNPTLDNMVTPPTIIKYSKDDSGDLKFNITDYNSNILLPYVGVEVSISKDEEFQDVLNSYVTYELNNNKDFGIVMVKPDPSWLPGEKYFIRMRYMGGGYYSNYSNRFEFKDFNPDIQKPTIDNVEYVYKEDVPYTTTLNIVSSSFTPLQEGLEHYSTTWRIYKKVEEDRYDLVYLKEKDSINKTSLTIKDLIPSNIFHGEDFYITVQYYGNDETFSLESEKFKTSSKGLEVLKPDRIDMYPRICNISNPMFSINNLFKILVNGKTLEQNIINVESVEWNIISLGEFTSIRTEKSKDNNLKLQEGYLTPDTEYIIQARYKHKILGYSPYCELRIKTEKMFTVVTDKLLYPKTTYDNCAYFGEIPKEELMLDQVEYMGVYEDKKSYKKGQEVKKDNKLYVCINNTPTETYSFDRFFKTLDNKSTDLIYKSGLPTPKWLIENIGLNPYNNSTDDTYQLDNFINQDTGWIKLQNKRQQIIYVAKQPILSNVSVNDLIRRDLYHPRRKTIRIGKHLYYIRLLINQCELGYDSLDPIYKGVNFNKEYNKSEPIDYKEDILLTNLINSKLAKYNYVDIGIPIENKELIYNVDNFYGYKYDNSNGEAFLNRKELPYADERILYFRPVLELIEEKNKPFYNISKSLPRSIDVVEDGEFTPDEYYDPYLDAGYLGYVPVEDFLTSEAIDLQTNLISNKSCPISGWYKFYYRGLVYFIPNGINLKGVNYRTLNKFNMVTPTPLFNYNVHSDKITFGKLFYKNMIFNTMCPNSIKYTTIREKVKLDNGRIIDLFENKDKLIEPNYCFNTFVSDVLYSTLEAIHPDRTQPGYKGKYKSLKIIELFKSLGAGDGFLTSDVVKYSSPKETEKPVINLQSDVTRVRLGTQEEEVDVITLLTINPIFDNKNLW